MTAVMCIATYVVGVWTLLLLERYLHTKYTQTQEPIEGAAVFVIVLWPFTLPMAVAGLLLCWPLLLKRKSYR